MFSYPINSNCCSSCVSLRKRFYIPPSQWIVTDGTFSRTVGYNHIVSSGTTVPSVSHHIVSSDRVSRPGMGILCSNILSRATGVSICRDSAGIYIFQNMSWGWEMRVRRYDQVWPRVKQHLFKLSFCRFSIMCHYHISPHPACYAAIWSKSGFYWFIKVLQVLYGINITTSHHFIVCFKWHRGVHWLEKAENTWTACQKSKVESWKSKVEVQCWVETNFDSRHSFSLLQSQSLCNSTLIIYYHLSENNEKDWVEMLALIWLKSKSYATRPMLSPQCGPLWTTYSNSAAPFSNISIKCGQDINI